MSKRYFFLIAVIIGFIVLSLRQYLIFNNQQKDETADFIDKQILLCGKSIEDAVSIFEEAAKFEFAHRDMQFFLDPNIPNNDVEIYNTYVAAEIKRIRRFFSNNQILIKSISIYNDSIFRDFYRNRDNYYSITSTLFFDEKQSLESLPKYKRTDSSYNYIQPITNVSGEVVANVDFSLNIEHFLGYHFEKFYIGKNSWHWAINQAGEILISNYSEPATNPSFDPSSIEEFQDKLNENLHTSKEHTISTPEEINTYSQFYPIKIFGTPIGIIFSINTDTLYAKQDRTSLYFLIYFLIVIIGIIILFSVIINQMILAQRRLESTDTLLRKANKASEILLTTSDFENSIQNFFEITADSMGYQRAFILKYEDTEEDSILGKIEYEWRKENIELSLKEKFPSINAGIVIDIPFDQLADNEDLQIIKVSQGEESGGFDAIMNTLDCKSFVKIPLLVDEKVYGIVGLMDCHRRRQSQNLEDTLLVNFANAVGGAISIQHKNEEMKLAMKEAKKANMAKSEFLSRISHELRTPLNSILGFAQLMELTKLDEKQKNSVQFILSGGKHLLNLINEVLDISRIESGNMQLNLESISIDSTIFELIDVIHQFAQSRNIEITHSNIESKGYYIYADRQRFKQVLLNLLSNAVKYNREGGKVHINAQVEFDHESSKNMLRLSVLDTGYGISKENMSKIFTPFERAGAERTQIEGTGLGLSVVKKLIDAMDGKFGVESTVDKGSEFWVSLPLDEKMSGHVDIPKTNDDSDLDVEKRKGTILYIEDNIPNIELVEQILSNFRPKVKLVSSQYGQKIIPLAHELSPNLILLDLNLPDIHGSEALMQLQEDPETSSIPVVVISADAIPHQINNLLSKGAKGYLTKPIDVPSFIDIVDKYID